MHTHVRPVGRRLLAFLVAGGLAACTDAAGPRANRPPAVTVTLPTATVGWAGGDTLPLSVLAVDPEQGRLSSVALSWWAELHHGAHTHPFHPVTLGSTGALAIPRVGHTEADVFLRVYGRGVDAAGLADTAFVDVLPRTTTLTLLSQPAGLLVTLDGQPHATPFTETAIVGMRRLVAPVDPQESASLAFSFRDWADAATFERELIVPDGGAVLTARFDSVGAANAAPEVTLDPIVGADALTAGTTLTVSATVRDADGDAFTVSFMLDGVEVATVGSVAGQDSYSAGIPLAVPGRHAVAVAAEDARGKRRTSAPVEIVVAAADGSDAIPPLVTLTSPAADTRGLAGAILVEANAEDDVGVAEVIFAVDDSVFASDATPPYAATLPSTAGFASGRHTLRVRARDAAGNWSDWSRAAVEFGGAVDVEAGFSVSTWVSGLDGYLTAMAFAPDGRLFVAEQGGALRVVKNGGLLPTPFATLPTSPEGERGLLGVAVDPDFATTGWIYVYYTSVEGGAAAHNRIVRLTADGDVATPGSAFLVLQLPPVGEGFKHNGGAMHFGPDGKLYVAVGDGTIAVQAQSLENPFGKILRLNRNGTVPADNPFVAQTSGANRFIWALGLRNPFTFTIDPVSGRTHINDVGANDWEEINLGRAGANFGWPQREGPGDWPLFDAPLFSYAHTDSPTLFDGNAVIGGAFYPADGGSFGTRFAGDYFFADFVAGWVYRLDAGDEWRPAAFAQLHQFVTGLTVGPDGALYVLTTSNIRRIAR